MTRINDFGDPTECDDDCKWCFGDVPEHIHIRKDTFVKCTDRQCDLRHPNIAISMSEARRKSTMRRMRDV